MKINFQKKSLVTLRILLTISVFFYTIIFIGEATPPFSESLFGIIMVYVLFLIFLIGYFFAWKDKKQMLSGIIITSWYVLLLILGFFVWTNAGMVIGLGFPVGILGVLLIIYSYLIKTKKKNNYF